MIKKEVIMYKVMTPGPTQVKENVRMARSLVCTNPDLDEDFVEFYKDTCELISSLHEKRNSHFGWRGNFRSGSCLRLPH